MRRMADVFLELGVFTLEKQNVKLNVSFMSINASVGSTFYFPAMLFTMLYKVVPTFEFADKILKCDHSNESY